MGKEIIMVKLLLGLLVVFSVIGSFPCSAQVASNGFFVEFDATINAASSEVYGALVDDVSQWWNPEHTYSGKSKNLSIDARPGGCFCEKLAGGGGLEHLRVVYADPGKLLRFSGGLGPLQAYGIAGSLSWNLSDESGATKINLTYSVGGYIEDGFEEIAPAVEYVVGDQLKRLQLFLETGKPVQDGD